MIFKTLMLGCTMIKAKESLSPFQIELLFFINVLRKSVN